MEVERQVRPQIRVLITDLDNTLWDWVGIWHASFEALTDVLISEGGIDRETLLDEAREIHQRHRTTEYSRLLEELPSFRSLADRRDTGELRRAAIQAAQQARETTMALYPGTDEVLAKLRSVGTLIVAYTESMAWPTSQRIRKLGLDGVIDYLYSSPDHDFPDDAPADVLRKHPDEHYALRETEHRHVERGVTKPNVGVLRKIIEGTAADPAHTVYLGDNLLKDMTMAQDAGVHDVLAAYGQKQNDPQYELLRRVTHWSGDEVEEERAFLKSQDFHPSYVLNEDIRELLSLFDFIAQDGGTDG